jgi:hypothetical protein
LIVYPAKRNPIVLKEMAELASEYWKLLKSFERALAIVPDEARGRLLAQARYASTRLDTILRSVGMRVVVFDGSPFEINMPAVAINADEFVGVESVLVERTIEPAIVSDMTVVITGKVYLTKA